jgi:hypothetical protein
VRILAAGKLISKDWLQKLAQSDPSSPSVPLELRLRKLDPNQRFSDALVAELRARLAPLAPAVAEARKVADLPRGRYEINWTRDLYSTLLSFALFAKIAQSRCCLRTAPSLWATAQGRRSRTTGGHRRCWTTRIAKPTPAILLGLPGSFLVRVRQRRRCAPILLSSRIYTSRGGRGNRLSGLPLAAVAAGPARATLHVAGSPHLPFRPK